METCMACDLTNGKLDLPGGRIYSTEHWVVEHCIGALGVGTLIVKPLRHCLHVWDLSDAETAELGPLLKRTTATINAILNPDQVYVCLWSHAGWEAVHIHFVLQPAWNKSQAEHAKGGPFLQASLFEANTALNRDEVEAFADQARAVIKTIDA